MHHIVEFSLRQRFLVCALTALLALLGVRSYLSLPMDAVPDITSVQVQVLTRAPGLSPVEVENLVTRPVERALAGLPELAMMRSVSRSAISGVTLIFDDDIDLERARELVAERLPAARDAVAESAERPEMGPLTTGLGEVYHFTLEWPGHSGQELRALFDWEIVPELLLVPGVVEANSWGGDEREIQVVVAPDRLLSYGLTLEDVEQALQRSGHTVGGAAVERGEEQVLLRLDGQYKTRLDVANQVVRTSPEGAPVLVSDVARVIEGKKPRFSAATADGAGPTQYAMVQMVAAGNARDVVERVRQRLSELETRLPEGVQIKPFYDRARFVDRVLATVFRSLIEGGLFVTVVLFLFLGNLRAGLVVATMIPLAMLGAFALMRLLGVSGNLMSLGAIDFGLVVDGAVVLVEGALVEMARTKVSTGHALVHDARKFGRSVAFGLLLVIVVYVPVLLLEGVEGKMFRPMALTVLFALGTALILTFTWIPALASLVLRPSAATEPSWVTKLRERYRPLLRFFVARRGLALGVGVLLAGLAAAAASRLGADFVPRLEEGDLVVQITRPPSLSLAEAEAGTTVVEQTLLALPEVDRVVSRTGSPDVATDLMGLEQSDVFVLLKDTADGFSAQEREELIGRMEEALVAALPGASFGFTQPIEMRMQELLGGIKSDFGIRVFGEDLSELRKIAAAVLEETAEVRGVTDLRIEPSEGLPLLTVRPDPVRAARFGVTPDSLELTVEALRSGRTVGTFFEQGRRFDVAIRLSPESSPSPESLGEVRIPLGPGRDARLGEVADLIVEDIPAQLSREQGRRRLLIEGNVRGRDLASFTIELERRLSSLSLPPGYFVTVASQYDNLKAAVQRFMIIIPLTLLAIVTVLNLVFSRFRPVGLVLLNIPSALSGGIFALYLRDLPFSISAMVGLIAVMGVATMNAVVLLTAIYARAEEQGLLSAPASGEGAPEGQESALECVVRGASDRLRPVLTTAVVASLGFVPMAFANGTGSEVQRPLATVVIGGLSTATFLTLLVLPALALPRKRWKEGKINLQRPM
jgi:cobalt-zinc-cadmium resistance protein CzcA